MFYGAGFGDDVLAANQVLLQFLYITAHALDGFAFAIEALVGQAYGAGNRLAFQRASALGSVWAVAGSVALSVVYGLGGWMLIDAMTTAEELRLLARDYLVWVVISPVLGVAPFVLDGIFIGAARSRDMRDMMAVSLVIYVIALAALIPTFGNHGLWIALLISFAARGVTLGLRYPRLERSVGVSS
ncbi:MAG: MATE family efflux transporter, partial [Shimia sp.]|nr:MATE family efflux transporter [Shimia sp.]